MAKVPKKVAERLSKQLGRFQKILQDLKDRDVGESDTVNVVRDMLADLFGFDKFKEVTSQYAIQGTFCDLAVTIEEGKINYLIEVKSIGLKLKENHLRQAVNYGSHEGIPWVVLTNGITWEIYLVNCEQKVDWEHTCSINILELNSRKGDDIEQLYVLCKEGLTNDLMRRIYDYRKIVNRFNVAALIQSDAVLKVLRLGLRKLNTDTKVTTKVTTTEIKALVLDVLKRDVTDGEYASEAQKVVKKASAKKPSAKTLKKRPAKSTPVEG